MDNYTNWLIRLFSPTNTEPPLCTVWRMSWVIFSLSAFINAIQAAGAAVCGSYRALQFPISTRTGTRSRPFSDFTSLHWNTIPQSLAYCKRSEIDGEGEHHENHYEHPTDQKKGLRFGSQGKLQDHTHIRINEYGWII